MFSVGRPLSHTNVKNSYTSLKAVIIEFVVARKNAFI